MKVRYILMPEIFYKPKSGDRIIPKLDSNPYILVFGEVGKGKSFNFLKVKNAVVGPALRPEN